MPSAAPAAGLSPRVRGNHRLGPRFGVDERSIPACAGEPVSSFLAMLGVGVYPRVCGGTPWPGWSGTPAIRLSPRVRGNPAAPPQGRHPQRSIPACAGEPRAGGPVGAVSEVYPRVCGGTRPQLVPQIGDVGLSPRVRGNRGPVPDDGAGLRSIPACAGEPGNGDFAEYGRAVYPRVCGGTQYRLRNPIP